MNACFWAEQELVYEQTCTKTVRNVMSEREISEDPKKSYEVLKCTKIIIVRTQTRTSVN